MMGTTFLAGRVWSRLRAVSRASRHPADVAVAYYSENAPYMLSLRRGSNLVVDASEQAVKGNMTCPAALLRLVQRGIRVFSVANLHAKVFVIGRTAFIGSANASRQSDRSLVEAMVETTDSDAVTDARLFVRGLCLQRMTPRVLIQLDKMYRRPRGLGGRPQAKRAAKSVRSELAPLKLAPLHLVDWPEAEAAAQKTGERTARNRRKHRTGWEVQSFRYGGTCGFRRGDMVIQVVDEGGDSRMVEAPGTVLHVQTCRTSRGQAHYVYLELPKMTRRPTESSLARKLGRGSLRRLKREGLVRDRAFAERLLGAWNAK